jgi:hypothetical protein
MTHFYVAILARKYSGTFYLKVFPNWSKLAKSAHRTPVSRLQPPQRYAKLRPQ